LKPDEYKLGKNLKMTPPLISQINPDRSQSLFWTCCLAQLRRRSWKMKTQAKTRRGDAVRNELLVYFGEKPTSMVEGK